MNLLDAYLLSQPPFEAADSAVRDYFAWQAEYRGVDFVPSADDDVDLRTYLLDLYTQEADPVALKGQLAALEQFYCWAQTQGIIAHNPFDEYNFGLPFNTSLQMEPRRQSLSSDLNVREVEELRALSQIA